MLERRGNCAAETDIAFAAARRLTQLLLAQRWQMGELQANIDTHWPVDLLEDLAAEHRMLFPQLQIDVDVAQAPQYWFYDETLLRLALGNAIHNACRHARARVTLQARTEDDFLQLDLLYPSNRL